MPPYGEGRRTASSSNAFFVFKLSSRIVTSCKILLVVKFQVVENLAAKNIVNNYSDHLAR